MKTIYQQFCSNIFCSLSFSCLTILPHFLVKMLFSNFRRNVQKFSREKENFLANWQVWLKMLKCLLCQQFEQIFRIIKIKMFSSLKEVCFFPKKFSFSFFFSLTFMINVILWFSISFNDETNYRFVYETDCG